MRRPILSFINSLPYVFVFIYALYPPKDPDLGWHLRYGEYFFQHHQILRDNIYSTTMTNYHWANGSWITDIITYFIYHSGGFLALSLASAAIVTVTFFLFAKAARFTLLEKAIFFPILAYFELPLNNHSFRGHQISMMFLGVLFLILSRYKYPSRVLWLVPLLFFLWMNTQLESFLGLAVFGFWIVFSWMQISLKEKKILTKEQLFLGKVLLVSILVTFLNPFGVGIHLGVLEHIDSPVLKKVNDYIPFPPLTRPWWNQVISLGLVIGGGLYLLFRKKFSAYLPWIGIPLILLLLSFNVRRYAWPAYYTILPLIAILWQPIKERIKRYEFFIAICILFASFASIIYLRTPFTKFTEMSWQQFCQSTEPQCTDKSAIYLQKHGLTKNLFTFYDWGGWLIWNFPEVKPSTDGRMHVWRDKNGYGAFAEYDNLMNSKKSIDSSAYDVVYLPMVRTIPIFTELDSLVRQGKWKIVYNDGKVGIIVRIKR